MRNLKTDTELTQEVLRRGEVYKIKRRKAIMSAAAGLAVVVAGAAIFASGSFNSLPSNNIDGADLAAGSSTLKGDSASSDGTYDIESSAQDSIISSEMQEIEATTEATIPYAEIYLYTNGSTLFASADLSKVLQIIDEAKQLGEESAPSELMQTEDLDNVYQIVIAQEALEIYYLNGCELYDKSLHVSYILSDTDANDIREKLDMIMKER